jgi:hypothetical protein
MTLQMLSIISSISLFLVIRKIQLKLNQFRQIRFHQLLQIKLNHRASLSLRQNKLNYQTSLNCQPNQLTPHQHKAKLHLQISIPKKINQVKKIY